MQRKKYNDKKKNEKLEEVVDVDDDESVLCSLKIENKNEKVKKKIRFLENVKLPMEAGMLYTINDDTFYLFTKNTWIRESRALCHIINDDTSLFDVIDIDELIQGSSGIMVATKKGNLHQCMTS